MIDCALTVAALKCALLSVACQYTVITYWSDYPGKVKLTCIRIVLH